jgi:hypothetical protein
MSQNTILIRNLDRKANHVVLSNLFGDFGKLIKVGLKSIRISSDFNVFYCS